MKPLTVLTGIILGTCLSIAVSLAAVLLMFLILGDDYPRLDYEFGALTESLAIFACMTAISAASFYALVKNLAWRLPAQGLMWAGVGMVAWYYWP
jgi:hypothetical protein